MEAIAEKKIKVACFNIDIREFARPEPTAKTKTLEERFLRSGYRSILDLRSRKQPVSCGDQDRLFVYNA